MSEKIDVRVRRGCLYDGDETYSPGETLAMDAEEAKTLLAERDPVIELVDGNEAAAEPEPAPETLPAERPESDAEVVAAIRQAISQLDPDNPKHWLKNGTTPDTGALEALLGWEISARERNAAMEQ